jgi:hypothetical protein
MLPLSLINYFELVTFFISLFAYPDLKGTPLRHFPFFLAAIVLVELTGRYLRAQLLQPDTVTLTTTAGFVFYTYIFRSYLQDPFSRRVALVFMIAYPSLVLIQSLMMQGFPSRSYLPSVGAVFMVLFGFRYFYELLLHPLEGRLRQDTMFWIITGILFFHLGSLSYNLLFNLLEKYTAGEGRKLFQSINNNLILMLYSCFIIAFLCKRSLRKSSLQ